MRRTLAQKNAGLTCGYSLAEIIVSMALIAMLSAAGFAVCYTAVNLQGKSERNLRIWNAADAVRGSFAAAVYAAGVSDDPQDKLAAADDFHRRLAFALDVPAPQLDGFTGPYALDGAPWTVRLVAESETALVGTPVPGGVEESEVVTAIRGLIVEYGGADDGTATYTFRYTYFSRDLALEVSVNLRTGTYYFRCDGYAAALDETERRYAAAGTAVYTLEDSYR